MIYSVTCASLAVALEQLKKIVKNNEEKGCRTVIFCEDRLTLAAERAVCSEMGGTFLTSVYTFARFLSTEKGKPSDVLSSQGSAMAIRKIIEENRDRLTLFKKLSAADAAEAVYDTIALLYSSRISAEDAQKAAESGGLLGGKLHDLAIVYAEYEKFLKESGKRDRNGYLRDLGEVIEKSAKIKGGCTIFLGFQAFTCTSQECLRAAFSAAEDVYGLFIGGEEDIYVNEAGSTFLGIAQEYGGAEIYAEPSTLHAEAEAFRRSLFNPESFYRQPLTTDKVTLFEATDPEEEMEFVAASIKKHVLDYGERYAKISVMLPDMAADERLLSRVFSRFKIPYYADRQLPLGDHSVCNFILSYLACALYGCRLQDVDGVISSPYFPAERGDKDLFRNYLLRMASFRGGIKKQPVKESLAALGFDIEVVSPLREKFLHGLSFITKKGENFNICGGLRSLLSDLGVEKALKDAAEEFRDERPVEAAFCEKAYDGVLSVLSEAESVYAQNLPLNEFVKILKSGFAAMKISLIPPKADAVFVGDLAATANTGSNVVFAVHLSGEVPASSSDTSLLTDREISALEKINVNVSPKIRQVNARKREICALNLCAFRKNLYLTYTSSSDGDGGVSEIISYARAAFAAPSGKNLAPLDLKRIERSGKAVPYYCSEKLPAVRHLRKFPNSAEASAVAEVLIKHGYEEEAYSALKTPVKRGISCGQQLYLGESGTLSPTTLETYFACPYLGFMRQGLRIQEREEGAVRPADTGNFIHSVLQDVAPKAKDFKSEEDFAAFTRSLAEEKLTRPPYSSLADYKSGKYVAGELVDEAQKIAVGMYKQIENSYFSVSEAEYGCEITLSNAKIYGRIDRVDTSGEMVRIIDYKTGSFDASPAKYYMGAKLQLPLYLLAVKKDRRAVGAYYFPAAVEYSVKLDGVFRLQGFMDGSDEVIAASDKHVQPKEKSAFVEAYMGGKKVDTAMSSEEFANFLEYSRLVSEVGVREMLDGNISPSPAEGVCRYCKSGGSCGISLGRDAEERKVGKIKCADIAEIVKAAAEGKDETD